MELFQVLIRLQSLQVEHRAFSFLRTYSLFVLQLEKLAVVGRHTLYPFSVTATLHYCMQNTTFSEVKLQDMTISSTSPLSS